MLRGVALSEDGKEMAGMGVGIGDYDCDGRLDIMRTHHMNQPSGLYHNNNDGNPDIFIVTGQVYPELDRVFAKYPRRSPRLVFRNQGNGKFL